MFKPKHKCTDPEVGTGGPDPPPEKSQKYKGSLLYLSGSLANHKATKPAFNVGPSLARQRNAIKCRWRADDDPLIVVFGWSNMDPL